MIRIKEQTTNESINIMGDDTMENFKNIEEDNIVNEIGEVDMIIKEDTIRDEATIENDKIDDCDESKKKENRSNKTSGRI